jgi:hypothetical protein
VLEASARLLDWVADEAFKKLAADLYKGFSEKTLSKSSTCFAGFSEAKRTPYLL